MPHWSQTAFGLAVATSFELPGMDAGPARDRPDLALWLAQTGELYADRVDWTAADRPLADVAVPTAELADLADPRTQADDRALAEEM